MGLKFVSYTYSYKDAPGFFSLVLFLPGCNFRCRHCINWRLVVGEERAELSEEDILYELKNNPVVEALVISGGELSIHPHRKVINFIKKVKKVRPELKVRIDTNGSKPEFLKALKDFVDGFAVDIKAPLGKPELYNFTAGVKVNTEKIKESIEIAKGMPLTIFRTVNYPWLSDEDREEIQKLLSPHYLNPFVEVRDCPFNGEG
ncbi:radical SAM protein [Aquifex sp.]